MSRSRGSNHHNSKVTEAQVEDMRRSYPAETYEQLANRFSLARTTVAMIVQGKSWAWLPFPDVGPFRIMCQDCGEPFEYTRSPRGKRRARCPECRWERSELRRRTNHQNRHFGISLEVRDQFVAIQHGKCAICQTIEQECSKGRLYVDHDHKTGEIRGMLCSRCNLFIGAWDDNPAILRRAAAYLDLSVRPTVVDEFITCNDLEVRFV
jgi:Recombination endonuclease VII